MLDRSTRWRQGSLLTAEAAQVLGLIDRGETERHVVIITHDCDLPNDRECNVELIISRVVSVVDPQFANARHPRQLHLKYRDGDEGELILALGHDGRRSIPKTKLAQLGEKAQSNYGLDADATRVLKQWLAARYARPAFPNAFEARLRKEVGKKVSVEKQIAVILGGIHEQLAGLFIDLDDARHRELDDREPYPLGLQVVYYADKGADARRAAEEAASQLTQLFHRAYGSPGVATEISLDSCEAVADSSITLADLRKLDQWRLEYLSLGSEPQEPVIGLGDLAS